MMYKDERKQEMYDWFHNRFVEPEFCDPLAKDLGSQYSCGGPFFARDILPAEFSEKYPGGLITEVAADIDAECPEWTLRKEAA